MLAGAAVTTTEVPEGIFVGQVVPPQVAERVPFEPAERLRVKVFNVKLAVAVPAELKVQVPVPVHAPDQPVKVEPVDAVAVRVIVEPTFTDAEQVVPQLMVPPAIVPEPVPDLTAVAV